MNDFFHLSGVIHIDFMFLRFGGMRNTKTWSKCSFKLNGSLSKEHSESLINFEYYNYDTLYTFYLQHQIHINHNKLCYNS